MLVLRLESLRRLVFTRTHRKIEWKTGDCAGRRVMHDLVRVFPAIVGFFVDALVFLLFSPSLDERMVENIMQEIRRKSGEHIEHFFLINLHQHRKFIAYLRNPESEGACATLVAHHFTLAVFSFYRGQRLAGEELRQSVRAEVVVGRVHFGVKGEGQ